MSGIDIKPLIGVTTPDLQGFFSVDSKIDQLLGQFEYIEPVDGEEPYYKLTVEDWLALKTGIEYLRSCEELLDENLAKNFHLISRLEMLARMLGEGQIHIGSAAREIADQANTVRFNNAPTVCVSSLLYALGCNTHEVDNVHRLFFRDGDASIMDCVRMSVRTDISDPNDVTYMSPSKNVRMCGVGSRSGGSNDANISLMFSSADGKSFVTIKRLADMSKNIKESCCNRFHITYHEDVDFPGKSVHYVYHMEDMWDTFEDTFNPTPEEIAVWDLAHPDDPFVGIEKIRKVVLSAIQSDLSRQAEEAVR